MRRLLYRSECLRRDSHKSLRWMGSQSHPACCFASYEYSSPLSNALVIGETLRCKVRGEMLSTGSSLSAFATDAPSWTTAGEIGSASARRKTVPRHSPKPMRRAPARSQWPRRMTVSPSSRKVRVSPLGSAIGCLPPCAQLEQRAALPGVRARQRAGAEQVARLQVAAVDRVVRDQLRGRPVGVA